MQENLKPQINEDFITETFDDEVLLYSMTDTTAIYLNDTANVVWLLCKEDLTVGEIIALLQKKYPEQQAQIKGDVITTLKFFLDSKVVSLETDES